MGIHLCGRSGMHCLTNSKLHLYTNFIFAHNLQQLRRTTCTDSRVEMMGRFTYYVMVNASYSSPHNEKKQEQEYHGNSELHGQRGDSSGANVSLIVRGDVHARLLKMVPDFTLVPDFLSPPNGCSPT